MMQQVLTSLEEQVQPKHTALIVVDPQKDFCASDGATAAVMGSDVSQIQAAVERLNPFIEKAREAGLELFWTRSGHTREKTSPVHRYRRSPTGEIIIAKEGSDGADWYKEIIKPLPSEHIITKRHYDAFEATELDHLLRINDIRTLIFTGFTTNVCVETTARHGYAKGYYIILVSDCTGAPTEREHESTLHNINKYFGNVVQSYELVKIWGNQ